MDARSVLQDLQASQDELLGDPEVCVAVLDGPVDLSHPCFEGADLTRLDTMVQEPAGQGPMSLHGTHVTSQIFGQPGRSVQGVAPRCRGLILPVFPDAEGRRVPQLDLARAIEQAVEAGAHIINISGGERAPDGQLVSMLDRALKVCDERGVLVVAAVGNEGCDCLNAPAAAPTVLAVGATGVDGEPLEINNWGAVYRSNGVIAPGQDIVGAAPGAGVRELTGSSFATPIVSGVAALLVTAQLRLQHPADPKAVGKAILVGADLSECAPEEAPVCRRHLAGALNPARAYALITTSGSSPATTRQASDTFAPLEDMPQALVPQAYASQKTDEGAQAMESTPLDAAVPQGDHTESESATNIAVNTPRSDTVPAEAGSPSSGSDSRQGVLPACACGCAGSGSCSGTQAQQQPPPEQSHAKSAGGNGAYAEPSYAGVTATSGAQPSLAARSGPPPSGMGAATDQTHPGVHPACGFGDSGSQQGLIYAIGTIGFDFRNEATRDSFRQQMPPHPDPKPGPDGRPQYREANPFDPLQLRNYLAANPWASDKLTWTLQIDQTPVYALEAELPAGMDSGGPLADLEEARAQAAEAAADKDKLTALLLQHSLGTGSYPPVSRVYKVFRDAIWGQVRDIPLKGPGAAEMPHGLAAAGTLTHGATEEEAGEHAEPRDYISRVSVPGVLTGETVRLYSGQPVPKVRVDARGLATWNETALIQSVTKAVLPEDGKPAIATNKTELEKTLRSFLDMVYYRFRNLGQSSADRALNFAGTNAFQFGDQVKDGLLSAKYTPGVQDDHLYTLDTITVRKSPYQRQDSDCQDVIVSFMDPTNDRRANVSYMFTIDVSAKIPVNLAPVHVFLGDL